MRQKKNFIGTARRFVFNVKDIHENYPESCAYLRLDRGRGEIITSKKRYNRTEKWSHNNNPVSQ